jgi:AcrR family transcriptional regulator
MPKLVDHEERRAEVLEATWRVVAREGIDGASMRGIAHEVGWSTGVLSHYFHNKDEIIRTALERAHSTVFNRAVSRSEEYDGVVAVVAVLSEGMPLDHERRLAATVEVAYWGRIMVKPELETYQRKIYELWWGLIRGLLGRAEEKGELRMSADCDRLATSLITAVDGVSVGASMFPDRLPPRVQFEVVRSVLDPALTAAATRVVDAVQKQLLAGLSVSQDGVVTALRAS